MLLLRGLEKPDSCVVNVDSFVPFTINIIGKHEYESKIYWRTGNFRKSLLEVAIEERTGELREITLTSADVVSILDITLEKYEEIEKNAVTMKKEGIPIFLIDGEIKNKLCDQRSDFEVYLGYDFILVKLKKNVISNKCIELEKMRLEVDKNNELISIMVKNLSKAERNQLKVGLNL